MLTSLQCLPLIDVNVDRCKFPKCAHRRKIKLYLRFSMFEIVSAQIAVLIVIFPLLFAIVLIVASETTLDCDDRFDCFPAIDSSDFVHPLHRPINLSPERSSKINTTFYLYAKWLQNSIFPNSSLTQICQSTFALKLDNRYRPCVFGTRELELERFKTMLHQIAQLSTNYADQSGKLSSANLTWWTGVVVHGFLDSVRNSLWMSSIKNKLLDLESGHHYGMVVLVDWSGGNGIPYVQATANTRMVGNQVAYFVQKLQKYIKIKIECTHIIGHSLGAHIAGYAGEKFRSPPLGRITALDPAGPNFEGMPPIVRIDPTDATLVDAIHTNGKPLYMLGYGMLDPVGHMDFYPNGGVDQPGCGDIATLPQAVGQLVLNADLGQIAKMLGCSHLRAIEFFTESIINASSLLPASADENQCHFVSIRCDDRCTSGENVCSNISSSSSSFSQKCARMGFAAYEWADSMRMSGTKKINSHNKFFLQTNEKKPFCMQ